MFGYNFQLIIIENRRLCFPKILPPGKAALSDLHLHLTLWPNPPPVARVRARACGRSLADGANGPGWRCPGKNKAQLAKEMILHARDNGVPFGWVGMDSFYGNLPWLRNDLDAEGITYIADIHRDTWVWLSLPKIGIPERRSQQGRSPTKTVVLDGEPFAVLVEDIAKQIPPSQLIRVYPREDDLPEKLKLLILRRDEGTDNIKDLTKLINDRYEGRNNKHKIKNNLILLCPDLHQFHNGSQRGNC